MDQRPEIRAGTDGARRLSVGASCSASQVLFGTNIHPAPATRTVIPIVEASIANPAEVKGLARHPRPRDKATMEWRDEGTLLSVRMHGESSAIIEVFTAAHGRHAGVVRGGASRRMAPLLQPGAQIAVTWRARLDDHIGAYVVEPLLSRAFLMGDRLALGGLNAVCAMLTVCLPERAPHVTLWHATMALLDMFTDAGWPCDYLRWEVRLLEELGFGLDLSRCAVTGARDGLAFVSPKTGRAVSVAGAGDWADRLLPLPSCLAGQGPAAAYEVVQGLAITGHFLARELAPVLNGRPLPDARARLIGQIARGAVRAEPKDHTS